MGRGKHSPKSKGTGGMESHRPHANYLDEQGAPSDRLQEVAGMLDIDPTRLARLQHKGAIWDLNDYEVSYLLEHWHLLDAIEQECAAYPDVELAVLIHTPESDSCRVLVQLHDKDNLKQLSKLELNLAEKSEYEIEVWPLPHDPIALAQVLHGRPLCDRVGAWERLKAQEGAINEEARLAAEEASREALRLLKELAGEQ